jgi:hypothetical protein
MGNGLFPLYHFTQKRLVAFVPTLREMVTKAVFPYEVFKAFNENLQLEQLLLNIRRNLLSQEF